MAICNGERGGQWIGLTEFRPVCLRFATPVMTTEAAPVSKSLSKLDEVGQRAVSSLVLSRLVVVVIMRYSADSHNFEFHYVPSIEGNQYFFAAYIT